jgi:multiple sugar transport system permease protein
MHSPAVTLPSTKPPARRIFSTLPYNLFVWAVLGLYLLPVFSMCVTALMSTDQLTDAQAPLYPARVVQYTYQNKAYPLYYVPTDSGLQQWALVKPGRKVSQFVDPQRPEAGLIEWTGNARPLPKVYEMYFAWDNFTIMLRNLPFTEMLRNTFIITLIGELGVLISSVLVAYGFARFPLPGGDLLFYILIATILIPDKITFVPTYFFYMNVLHWKNTIYPIIVPLFFGQAVYIFLLRQNFKSIPIDLEEAAMLDGAGPIRRLFSVILPQSWPVITTVAILHFFYAWNETRLASVYLNTNPVLMPVSFGVQVYQSRVPIQNVIEASSIIVLIIPVIVLLISQRFFMQGLIITGAEK